MNQSIAPGQSLGDKFFCEEPDCYNLQKYTCQNPTCKIIVCEEHYNNKYKWCNDCHEANCCRDCYQDFICPVALQEEERSWCEDCEYVFCEVHFDFDEGVCKECSKNHEKFD